MSFIGINQGQKLSISSVCVYCGSSSDVAPHYKTLAHEVGTVIAQHKLTLVYGGGNVGLMGIVANAGMSGGTKVIGIIPEHIRSREIQHTGLTELHIVPDMHTRKRMMVERSDAFVILPGGLGTLDETFEIMTWKKLQLHNKPIIVFNQDGYWDPLLALVDQTINAGFSQPSDRSLYKVVTDIKGMLDAFEASSSPPGPPLTGQM